MSAKKVLMIVGDFAEDYELAERLGGGVEIALPDIGFGQHSLTATVFLADTSVLSESIFVNRGRTRLASGGPNGASTEANIVFHLNPVLSIQSLLVVEPVLDSRPGRDRFFGDHGGYFEELYVQVAVDVFRFFGGKFDAPFGTAWDAAPGIFTLDGSGGGQGMIVIAS